MDFKKQEYINVLNYSASYVILTTRDRQFTLNPAIDGVPSMTPMRPIEIEDVNSNSSIFRTGGARFESDVQKDVYEYLRILDWEDILFEDVIEDIILHPTMEKLQRIVDVKNVAVIERVKGILTVLKNSQKHDISTRVNDIINTRYNEVTHGKMNTGIALSSKDTVVKASVEDVNELKAQNDAMATELANMKAMMEELMKKQNSKPKTTENKEDTKKSVGRPPKENK